MECIKWVYGSFFEIKRDEKKKLAKVFGFFVFLSYVLGEFIVQSLNAIVKIVDLELWLIAYGELKGKQINGFAFRPVSLNIREKNVRIVYSFEISACVFRNVSARGKSNRDNYAKTFQYFRLFFSFLSK